MPSRGVFLVHLHSSEREKKIAVEYLKEEILFLIAVNTHTKEKISEVQDDCDTEEEKEETETLLYKNRFANFEELFQIEPLEGEVVYACNVCNEGLDTENDAKKHVYTHHKDILQTIRNKSEDDLKISDKKKIVCNKLNSDVEKIKAKYSYSSTCQACVVYVMAKFISSNHNEINDHIFSHLEMSGKESELK